MTTRYALAERFKAPQGEGLYTGTPMAFMRTVGCSVGKQVCTHCDTEFDRMREALGGGVYAPEELATWAKPYRHVCVTGGEPLDRDLRPLLRALGETTVVHVETSGTKHPEWLDPKAQPRSPGEHAVGMQLDDRLSWRWWTLWVTVSPKPGYLPHMVEHVADEVKVILGGLGDGPGWPTLEDAVRWADMGKMVYVQPRNDVLAIDPIGMKWALDAVDRYPQLRLSTQLHKYTRTR